ncbi:cell wall-binding repeat-containing protein [Arthrobacter rhombi]|uniref:cell wall-binding repeat-containing protein n=1 Tax=Arthrobacter rhombi TaxID=71253 RepID=UPI003FD21192
MGSPTKKTMTTTPVPDVINEATEDIRAELDAGTKISAKKRIELSEQALDALDIKALDARMGQGNRRIQESGDPQAPTIEELKDLASGAEELAAETTKPSPDAPAERAPSATEGPQAQGLTSTTEKSFEASPAGLVAPTSLQDLKTYRPPGVLGIDISHHQGTVNWSQAWSNGSRFAYVKSTQSWPSTLYQDPNFAQNYNGAYKQGMMRGAYHFAMPAHSSGATQAREFLSTGGGWSNDGKTLPPLLDIEWNPYNSTQYPEGKGNSCFGMSPSSMVKWIQDFGTTIKAKTGRLPMIYTAQSWWNQCTGSSTAFKNWPLHVSLYPTASGPKNPRELPKGWKTFDVWQYSSNSNLIGSNKTVDANVWNGDLESLQDFARNKRSTPYRLTTDYLGSGNGRAQPTRLAPVRLSGSNRYNTPISISKRTFPSGASNVIVASGENFPDALAGSPLATLKNAPLLLTLKNRLPAALPSELTRLQPKRILVLGGPDAVSDATVAKLRAYGPVTRVWGHNEYDTSSKIADNWNSSSTVFLATGERFEDAMSLAAVAAGRRVPMLLTRQSKTPATTLDQLKRLKPSQVYLAGGPEAISSAAEAQIRKIVPKAKVVRYGGKTRYDTSAKIADSFWASGSQRQFIATGSDFADGLTGSVAAAYNGAPLLVAKKKCLPVSVSNSLASMKGWTNILLGGSEVLDSTVAYRKNGRPNVC